MTFPITFETFELRFLYLFTRTLSQERKHRLQSNSMKYWFSTVSYRLKRDSKPSFEKGEAWFIWAGHWPVWPGWTLTGLAELKSNYHFCTEQARMFEAIIRGGLPTLCWSHSFPWLLDKNIKKSFCLYILDLP